MSINYPLLLLILHTKIGAAATTVAALPSSSDGQPQEHSLTP